MIESNFYGAKCGIFRAYMTSIMASDALASLMALTLTAVELIIWWTDKRFPVSYQESDDLLCCHAVWEII